MTKKEILIVQDLMHTYMEKTPLEHKALQGVNLSVKEGESVAIIGHTGSGKSTLIQHFNGLLRPQQGRVIVDGEELSTPKLDLRALRRKVGLVFQNPEDQIFEKLIGDDVAYGPLKMGLPLKDVRDRVKWAMEMVGLPFEDMKDRPTFALSGGQKRKVAIAGVLALQPKILILDEPTAGLDPRSRQDMLERIQFLNQKEKMTVIFVSHNMEEVAYLAEHIFVMANGRTILQGTPREIFGNLSLLEQYQIGAPESVEILHSLQSLGYSVDTSAYEVEAAASEIIQILCRKTGEKDG